MNIYCGNNANNTNLLNGNKILGNRYDCLRRGIGKGFSLPYDVEYDGEYQPIDDFKIYCGNSNILPNGYDKLGSLSECNAIGIGIGKSLKAQLGPTPKFKKILFIVFIYILILSLVFGIFYYSKPKIIYDKVEEKIIWEKFILYYTIFFLLFTIIFYLIVKRNM